MTEINKTLAVDFDATIAHFDHYRGLKHIGAPLEENIKILRWLHSQGVRILIHSCRMNGQWDRVEYERVKANLESWLREHDVPYDHICGTEDGKPFAHAYWDDRAVPIRPNNTSPIYAQIALNDIMSLLERSDIGSNDGPLEEVNTYDLDCDRPHN